MKTNNKFLTGESLIQGRTNIIKKSSPSSEENSNETRLIVTYNVEDASNPTPLFIGAEGIGFSASTIYDKIEIDNVEINISDLLLLGQEDGTVYGYQLTSGEHTVKYTLKDPTMIGLEIDEETGVPSKLGATFINCPITSVEIPSGVTSIGYGAFAGCAGLTSIIIPDSVTSIDNDAFDTLELVVIYATTPPSEDIFFQPIYEGNDILTVIQVPSEAVNTYKATWSDYAEIIEAISTTSVITFTIDNVLKLANRFANWSLWVNTDNRFIIESLNRRNCVQDTQTGYWVSTTSDSSGVVSSNDKIISNGQYYTVEVLIK